MKARPCPMSITSTDGRTEVSVVSPSAGTQQAACSAPHVLSYQDERHGYFRHLANKLLVLKHLLFLTTGGHSCHVASSLRTAKGAGRPNSGLSTLLHHSGSDLLLASYSLFTGLFLLVMSL